MNINDLIGLELSDAVRKLDGVKFRLEYYISEKQKLYDSEIVINAQQIDDTVVLTVSRFLLRPVDKEGEV